MLKTAIFTVFGFLFAAGTLSAADVYEFDTAHSSIGFTVKHLGISKVSGRFGKFSGSITLAKPESRSARVEAVIEAASVDTAVEKRDDHLRGPDFFDVKKYPEIRFVSTTVSRMKGDRFTMEGDLEMHGVTKKVTLDVEFGGKVTDPWGDERAAFTATGTLDRKDFGIRWNKVLDSGGVMISDEVKIILEIEAVKKK